MLYPLNKSIFRKKITLVPILSIILFLLPAISIKAQPDLIRGITIEYAERFSKEFNQQTCENLRPKKRMTSTNCSDGSMLSELLRSPLPFALFFSRIRILRLIDAY